MAVRLVELRRVLKPSGSLYLHCDPTASHYLKLLLDSIFGHECYRNEIVWKCKAGRGETNNAAIRFGVSHDVLLFYARSRQTPFHRQYRPNNPAYIATKFVHVDKDGRRYRLDNLIAKRLKRFDLRSVSEPSAPCARSRLVPDRSVASCAESSAL
ncbi:DNA methyltransferase [Mesorhizobium sp. B2-3-11]|uniref:DNA methyltransferase n=1 Tax=Mesorhizobium sp. B2-3-11 TaxID=2589953 RepID=UPI001FF0009F|nr:DNA methyltransferase [Mesorhizobium sp. B2-3-11]